MTELSDPDVRRVCTLSGAQATLLQDKLITLRDAEKTLVISIGEVGNAMKDDEFWGAMLVCAKIVQVSCDLSIAFLEEETGPAGKGISVLYDISKIIADALNGEFDAKEGFKFSANIHADVLLELAKRKGPKFARVASHIKTLANLADDLVDFFEKRGSNLTASSGLYGAKRSAQGILQRIRAQIVDIETALAACA